jgi:hypothetical protein
MCPPEDVHPFCDCFSCTLGIFSEEGRRSLCDEWIETEWAWYRTQALALIELFPKLKLFEWFLEDYLEDWLYISRPELAHWEWTIARPENSAKPVIKQRIRMTPYDKLLEEPSQKDFWSLTKGLTCDQEDNLIERMREQFTV